MPPKIGIATFANYNNYGSLFQRYAMEQALAMLGFEGEALHIQGLTYTRKHVWDRFITNLPKMRERNRRFKEFMLRRAPLRIFENHEALEASHEEYHAFITGSDQVWRDPAPFLFLEFAKNRPKLSYAASGLNHLPQKHWDWAGEVLAQFASISVREKNIIPLVEKIAHRNATQVLDPTLLMNRSFWDALATPPKRKRPYLFCYFVQSRRHPLSFMPQAPCHFFFDTVNQLARQTGLQPRYLCGAPKGYLPFNFSDDAAAGPQDFLGLIRDAELVVTDSYHATLFSIQFQRPFFSIPVAWKKAESDESQRHRNILELLGLSRRFLPLDSPLPSLEEIPLDFSEANLRLDRERKRSLEYLRESLAAVV